MRKIVFTVLFFVVGCCLFGQVLSAERRYYSGIGEWTIIAYIPESGRNVVYSGFTDDDLRRVFGHTAKTIADISRQFPDHNFILNDKNLSPVVKDLMRKYDIRFTFIDGDMNYINFKDKDGHFWFGVATE